MNAFLLSAVLAVGGVSAYVGTQTVEQGLIVRTDAGDVLACEYDYLPPEPLEGKVYLRCVDFVNTRGYIGDQTTGMLEEIH